MEATNPISRMTYPLLNLAEDANSLLGPDGLEGWCFTFRADAWVLPRFLIVNNDG